MKYIIYIDYKASTLYEYKALEANNLKDAIKEADEIWETKDGYKSIYLMRIMEKVGKIETPYKAGYKYETYNAILCRRSHGWHQNNDQNSEGVHMATKNWLTNNKNEIWYEIAI